MQKRLKQPAITPILARFNDQFMLYPALSEKVDELLRLAAKLEQIYLKLDIGKKVGEF
jgi:hypothetical protein